MDDLMKTMRISSSAMKAQGTRLRVISENVANADSMAKGPGQLPYQRKTVTFKNVLDRNVGLNVVKVNNIGTDKSEFEKRFDPNHPAADVDGYVQIPNVNPLIEMMDMREAQRSYDANLNVVKASKQILKDTIDLLR
ncbi:MAG: flagellar basal body rod protein FlgC [Rhodospirillales bacterium RIFCSPLOWO2_12_FULL_58_28]|nr:MAG: flagellar basal body rod protein FlgC [Rhodospirillales bacterium RIFCSPLOWO2_02_FULL_58_16]OHC76781.1 MAG: flagellar basal body rod protein FlgC [Rhodospirillales bacterium RIFCSPLOWO2_12_FULL_58_28]